MTSLNYNLLATLPVLGELGTLPSLSVQEYLQIISENRRVMRHFCIIALADDLRRRSEILLMNSEAIKDLLVLDPTTIQNTDCIQPFFSQSIQKRFAADLDDYKIFELFFKMAAAQGEEDKGDFLTAWVAFEIALRNVLADLRAEKLKVAAPHHLLPELSDEGSFDRNEIATEFLAAENPLKVDTVLTRVRWEWLSEHDNWFLFTDDEVLAYGVKLLELHRQYRLLHGTPVASNVFFTPVQ